MTGELRVRDLGRRAYRDVWELQRRLVEQRHRGEVDDVLLVCEHDPVITCGRGTSEGFLLEPRFEVLEVERGGEATYHGPGQIVVYPIVRLAEGARDLHRWMRALESACIAALGAAGMTATRREGATGVWTERRKVASIGVAARRWVTYHGLALNHRVDLEHFATIQPCGFEAGVMTSMERELGTACPDRVAVVEDLVTALRTELAPFRAPSPCTLTEADR